MEGQALHSRGRVPQYATFALPAVGGCGRLSNRPALPSFGMDMTGK
jgi:hypothetical protein